jgi:hypothetical protein
MSNGNSGDRWNEDDVRQVLLNPVYTMGSKPTVDDETWVSAQKKLISDLGRDEYFTRLLAVIQDTFGDLVE